MSSPLRLLLFPGLGADSRMLEPQRRAFPHAETPNWIPHVPGESLRGYVERFARSLAIDSPAILGGVSMGGMVALEMARIVPARCVILIASCRHPRATNPLLRLSERLTRPLPSILLDKGRVLAPLFLGRGGRLGAPERKLLVRMARDLPVPFLRWAPRAVLAWQGCEDPGVPVYHIHGDRDIVFALRRVRPDRVVPGGIHVLNLSHPDEVNAFIGECIQRSIAPEGSDG
jgi:pimeloyl-ACP methyl ester carboxylesterase